MMVRLTSRSLAGTARTLVAVGTPSEASMLATMRPAAPRSGTAASSAFCGAAVGTVDGAGSVDGTAARVDGVAGGAVDVVTRGVEIAEVDGGASGPPAGR